MMRSLKQILIYTLTLSAFSCGIPLPLQKDLVVKDRNALRQFATTDPTFNTFVERFEQYGKQITNNAAFVVGDVPINFGDTENVAFQGVCFEYPNGDKEIIIRKSWWDSVDDDYRESLIFHELGHCRLGREHLDDVVSTTQRSYKISMMNSIILGPTAYSTYRSEYLQELFSGSTADLFSTLGL